MNSVTQTTSEYSILGLPRRPRGKFVEKQSLADEMIGRFWSKNVETFGNAITNSPQDLQTAITDYFEKKGLRIVGFYRSLVSVEVFFQLDETSQYWSVKSVLPDTLKLEQADRDDWLYGNLIKRELPKKLRKIKKSLKI